MSTAVTSKWKEAAMIEVVTFAFIVSVAFVLIGKTVPHHYPKSRKRIHHHDRVHYMRMVHRG